MSENIPGPPELAHTRECWRCAHRYTQHGAAGRECPECGYQGSSTVEDEHQRDTMCARHWLLEGVRNGSCADCLGAEIPDGMGAVIVTDDCGVTFAGAGGGSVATPAVLAPLSVVARAEEVSPGDVLATFPLGSPEEIEVCAPVERQATLAEVGE